MGPAVFRPQDEITELLYERRCVVIERGVGSECPAGVLVLSPWLFLFCETGSLMPQSWAVVALNDNLSRGDCHFSQGVPRAAYCYSF